MSSFEVVDLGYVSLYVRDLERAVAFYTAVFGPEEYTETGDIHGWRMGRTWLTLFPGTAGADPGINPSNTEFAIHVARAEQVDALHAALIAAGAIEYRAPKDTWMYERMRYSIVTDPFGVRIDVYCPLD